MVTVVLEMGGVSVSLEIPIEAASRGPAGPGIYQIGRKVMVLSGLASWTMRQGP